MAKIKSEYLSRFNPELLDRIAGAATKIEDFDKATGSSDLGEYVLGCIAASAAGMSVQLGDYGIRRPDWDSKKLCAQGIGLGVLVALKYGVDLADVVEAGKAGWIAGRHLAKAGEELSQAGVQLNVLREKTRGGRSSS